jgi:DNA-binding CsgD family transcriptional regulator/PAS domain-containing protein
LETVMAHEKAIRDLIRLIYECSVDARQWPHFLSAFAVAVDAPAASLSVLDARNHHGAVTASHGIDPFWERRFAEYYAGLNVWMQGTSLFRVPGHVERGEEVIRDAALEKTEFYNDFLRPQNQFYVLGGVLTREDSTVSLIAALRSKAGGPIQGTEQALTLELVPHLRTALRLHHRIAGLEKELEYASDALDHVSGSLIVTDSSSRILYMNRSAEALLKSNRGLSTAPADGLRAGSPSQTADLREFIARAAGTVTGNGKHPGGVIQVQRSGGSPLRLQIAPLASSSGSAGRRPAVAIFIAEAEGTAKPNPELLGAILDLSPTEARLTAALVRGETIQQFAREAGVSVNTARTLLSRVFSKTNVSRQAELVGLALARTGGLGWGP